MADPLILRLENILVRRLSGGLGPVPVNPFPADPGQWRRTHPTAHVLVLYTGSRWSEQASYIERVLNWTVVVILRNLRTHAPAYALLEIVQGLLSGWFPLAAEEDDYTGPFEIQSDRFAGHDEGSWVWEIDLNLTVQTPPGQAIDSSTLPGQADDSSTLADFLRWRDKFDIAPLNDEDITPVADYEFFDAEDYVDLPGPG